MGKNGWVPLRFMYSGDQAIKLLTKFGLLESAIDFAAENGHYDFAFELAKENKAKLSEIYLKHAMSLEDQGKFKEAEAEFIQAGKPKEAIEMHIHNEDYDSALVVAEAYDPDSVPEILTGQAKIAFSAKDFMKMETLLLRAQKPELVLKIYKESSMWKEAMRFGKQNTDG